MKGSAWLALSTIIIFLIQIGLVVVPVVVVGLHRFYVGNYYSCNYQPGESSAQIFASLMLVLLGSYWGSEEI